MASQPTVPGRLRSAVDSLFPECPRARLTAPKVAVAAGLLAIGTVAELARQGGAGALNTLYAEDGQIFLTQALHGSAAHAFSTSYVGYFHAVPRLLAEVVAAAPLRAAAPLYAVLSALIIAGVGLLVYRASACHIESRFIRGVLGASVVLVPVGQIDSFNTSANLHWFLMFGCVWVLLWKTEVTWELVVGCAVLFLTALSDPITAVLIPLALARLVALKGVRDRLFSFACFAGLALQVLAIVVSHAHREGLAPTINPVKLAVLYGYWVVGGALVGVRFLANPHVRSAQALAALALAVAGVMVLVALRLRRKLSPIVPVLLAMSVLFHLTPVIPVGGSPQRYAVAPVLLLFSAIACAVDRLIRLVPASKLRLVQVGALLVLVVVWGANYRVPNDRGKGVRWTESLAQARSMCRDEGAASVTVPITPAGWHATLPCADVGTS